MEKAIKDPHTFPLNNNAEVMAYEKWKELEPDNSLAFFTTYLRAAKKGVSSHLMYKFASEIKQDPTVKNKGAVFTNKVNKWLDSRKKGKEVG